METKMDAEREEWQETESKLQAAVQAETGKAAAEVQAAQAQLAQLQSKLQAARDGTQEAAAQIQHTKKSLETEVAGRKAAQARADEACRKEALMVEKLEQAHASTKVQSQYHTYYCVMLLQQHPPSATASCNSFSR